MKLTKDSIFDDFSQLNDVIEMEIICNKNSHMRDDKRLNRYQFHR